MLSIINSRTIIIVDNEHSSVFTLISSLYSDTLSQVEYSLHIVRSVENGISNRPFCSSSKMCATYVVKKIINQDKACIGSNILYKSLLNYMILFIIKSLEISLNHYL